jgi:RimJ/RimL family protein N-acetyltransferase
VSRSLESINGDVAQLVEHLLCKQGVGGSSPLVSTERMAWSAVILIVRVATRIVVSPAAYHRRMHVSLRPLVDADLDAIYEQMKDPESVRMAAFTPDDPSDRQAFLVHRSRVRDDPSVVERVIEADGTIAGTIASFRIDDRTEVTYWIDRALWGRGIASAALQSLLSITTERPVFARAASDNAASLRVLEKAGFRRIGVDRGFARGRGEEIEETILRLD